jgi:uncharacterized protein YkwD
MSPLVPRRALTLAVLVAAIFTFVFGGAAQAASLTRPESALLRAMNSARAAHGLRPLRIDNRLVSTSRAHSRAMLRAQALFHGAFTARIRRAGVQAPALGENLAWGSASLSAARTIVDLWLQSPEHRANLLRPGFRTVGVGAVRGTFDGYAGALVVTTDFAGQ